mmetsp:Transcript_86305/g.225141  ORF Transcript_86305/g.225141 Transcript_86305/m.225141 type:complete len:169 (-) Transcript_86305:71-577(-)
MWDSVGSDTGAGAHEGGSGGSEQDVLAMWDSVGSGGQPYQSGGHDTGSGQRLVGFGKHRDLTYQEALSQEPDYCDWVTRQSKSSDASPMVMEFAHWLEQNVPSAGGGDSDPKVGFGKHKHLTYEEALVRQKGYCQWVVQTFLESKEDSKPAMVEFAKWLQEMGIEPRT